MNVLNKIFGKSKEDAALTCEPLVIYAPVSGKVIALKDFPDPVFSQEILGPGCGIIPSIEQIIAPFNGVVIQLTDTKHAIGLKSEDGMELLIHIGVDTVDMNGIGFSSYVKEGQTVHMGEKLISFDKAAIRKANHSDTVAIIVTNADDFAGIEKLADDTVTAGTSLLKVQKEV